MQDFCGCGKSIYKDLITQEEYKTKSELEATRSDIEERMEHINEEFLLCAICHNHYKEPKLLPCLHTFCLKCINSSIHDNNTISLPNDAHYEPGSIVVFKCPVCKGETELGLSPDRQIIATGISDNYFISNIVEKVLVQKDGQVCESCRYRQGEDHVAAKAEVWCQNCKVSFCDGCIKAHSVIRACRDHVVVTFNDMEINPLQTFIKTKRDIPCTAHEDKILEFYCTECRVVACSKCVAVHHRRCDTVETCIKTAEKLKTETESFLKDLDMQGISLTDWQQQHTNNIKELEENKESLSKEIQSIRISIDLQLAQLEKNALEELELKNTKSIDDVKERMEEIDGLKKNIENTSRFLRHLLQYGSDCEFISVFDKVKQQLTEMNTNMNKRKVAKLVFRHAFTLDGILNRVFDVTSLGEIVDVVDTNKKNSKANSSKNVFIGPVTVATSSAQRTGTFRVDKAAENQQQQLSQELLQQSPQNQKELDLTKQQEQQTQQVTFLASKTLSRSSISMASNTSDSVSSHDVQDPSEPRRKASLFRIQQETCARLSAGTTESLPRPKRVNSTIEFRKTESSMVSDEHIRANTQPSIRCTDSTVNGRSLLRNVDVRPERRSKTPDSRMTKALNKRSTDNILSASLARRNEHNVKKLSQQSKPALATEKTNAQLLCTINGRTEHDGKRCWPLDVTVLTDGTAVITDFHNKKIKAFHPTGTVTCDILLPSWPHGITNIEKADVVVTMPEISTLVFFTVNAKSMVLKKRIKTVQQYRGICCYHSDRNNPVIIVSCCALHNQSIDVMTLEGEVLFSHREDHRKPDRNLFTAPYYVAVNTEGEIIVSDCETKVGLLHLDKKGNVKHDYLSVKVVIQDPRGICTDRDGNVYVADKSAHAIHSFTSDGHYGKCVVSAADALHQPIALCISPSGHLIVTQDNGDIKIYAID